MTADADVAANARGLKVHLRTIAAGPVTYRVVTLRPATTARFSSNCFHDKWHVLAGRDGAFVLGRLLWGLAFQRQPGTLVLLDAPHLVPTPFEADPPVPVLLVPAGLTRVDLGSLRALRRRLRDRRGPTSTIRWHTFGLPAALERDHDVARWRHHQHDLERMSRRAGFVCYTAPPDVLRAHAVAVYHMRDATTMRYHPLAAGARGRWLPDGEVQILRDFDDDVAAAAVARREVLAGADRALRSDQERAAVYTRKDEVAWRMRRARRPL